MRNLTLLVNVLVKNIFDIFILCGYYFYLMTIHKRNYVCLKLSKTWKDKTYFQWKVMFKVTFNLCYCNNHYYYYNLINLLFSLLSRSAVQSCSVSSWGFSFKIFSTGIEPRVVSHITRHIYLRWPCWKLTYPVTLAVWPPSLVSNRIILLTI